VNTSAPLDAKQAEERVLGWQTKLHRWAGEEREKRFGDLFNLVCDPATLLVAWERVKRNRGSRTAGVDGITRERIERQGVQRFLDELRQSIILGRLNPGERLVERELIAMMGVSRTVIREALRQLESEGLVAIIPNKGPVVRTLTLEEARELYAIRAVL